MWKFFFFFSKPCRILLIIDFAQLVQYCQLSNQGINTLMLKVKRAQGQNVLYLLPGARGKTTSPFGWPHGTYYVTQFNKPKVSIHQYHPYLLPKEYQKCYYYHSFTSSGPPRFQPPFPLPELWATKFRSVYLTFIFIVLLSFCGNVLLVCHL